MISCSLLKWLTKFHMLFLIQQAKTLQQHSQQRITLHYDCLLPQTTLHSIEKSDFSIESLFSPFNQLLGEQPFMCSIFPLIIHWCQEARLRACSLRLGYSLVRSKATIRKLGRETNDLSIWAWPDSQHQVITQISAHRDHLSTLFARSNRSSLHSVSRNMPGHRQPITPTT